LTTINHVRKVFQISTTLYVLRVGVHRRCSARIPHAALSPARRDFSTRFPRLPSPAHIAPSISPPFHTRPQSAEPTNARGWKVRAPAPNPPPRPCARNARPCAKSSLDVRMDARLGPCHCAKSAAPLRQPREIRNARPCAKSSLDSRMDARLGGGGGWKVRGPAPPNPADLQPPPRSPSMEGQRSPLPPHQWKVHHLIMHLPYMDGRRIHPQEFGSI
jgi:hypothetical protein